MHPGFLPAMIRNRPRVFAGLQLAIEMNAEMCDESPLALLDPPTRRTFIGPRIGPSIVLPLARSSHVAVMTAIGVEEKRGAVAPTSTLSSRSYAAGVLGSIPTTRLGLGIPREAGRPSWLPDARPDAKADSAWKSREPGRASRRQTYVVTPSHPALRPAGSLRFVLDPNRYRAAIRASR